MRRTVRLLIAGVLLLGLVASPAGAEGEAASATLTNVAVDATGIAVTGKATFVGPTEVLGEDPAADSVLPGTDLRSASVTPISNTQVRFDLEIGDLAAPTGGTPELVNYWWEFAVVRGNSTSEFALQAWRSSVAADLTCEVVFACPAGDPGAARFQLSTCAPDETTGQRTCSAEAVTGAITGSVFSWTLPLNKIGAGSGADIVPVVNAAGNPVPIAASHGVSGISWNSSGSPLVTAQGTTYRLGDVMAWEGWSYQRSVHLGIAPVETPDAEVATPTPVTTLSSSSSTSTNGNFTASLPLPEQPGSYRVVARACLGAANCGTVSRIITVP